MLEIRGGGFLGLGDRHFLLPVEAITSIADHEVHVNQTRGRIEQSPTYDPALEVAPAPDWGSYYGYYGMSPFLGSGYAYADFTSAKEKSRGEEHSDRTNLPKD